MVSYIEVMPSSQGEASALLRQYREASRKDGGNVRLEVLQQSGRPDHFALVGAGVHGSGEECKTVSIEINLVRPIRQSYLSKLSRPSGRDRGRAAALQASQRLGGSHAGAP